ncbi:MAG TPA: alpha/beta fold hydrolase [Bacillota bacterium]|nr:alpha/beta fold hydrolase [Bacillota bacterium]
MEQVLRIKSDKAELVATLHFPDDGIKNDAKVPLIIICHGFVGSRIGVNRLFVKAAQQFVSYGYAVLRFDYEGCGESSGEYGSYGLDRFIQQTKDVISFGSEIKNVDREQIILVGHSLGGAVAALTAARDPRIKKLVMWSAVGHPFHDIVNIVGEDEYKKTLSIPYIDYEGYAFTHPFFHSLSQYAPLEECKEYTGEVFLAHGTEDEVIPVDYCFHYQHAFNTGRSRSCTKEIIPGSDHTFSSIKGSKQLFASTLQWILKKTSHPSCVWKNKAI